MINKCSINDYNLNYYLKILGFIILISLLIYVIYYFNIHVLHITINHHT